MKIFGDIVEPCFLFSNSFFKNKRNSFKQNSDLTGKMKKVCIEVRRFPRTLCKFCGQKVAQFRHKMLELTTIQFFERRKVTRMCLVFNSISPNCNDVYRVLKIDL